MLYQPMTEFARLGVEVSCQHGEVSCAGRQVYKLRRVKSLHHTVRQVLIIRSTVLSMQLATTYKIMKPLTLEGYCTSI